MFDGVARWWDGFELWLAQQWFPLQFVLVVAVLLPICAAATWLLGRGVDFAMNVIGRLRPGRPDEQAGRPNGGRRRS
ncbi:hypothetical protein FHS23_002867 [Prauserella isguenensis]|uniref:Uncharacterized protein n=1 Tax=Prauserella isguenensis TaxID=1470180 RepID=A0A839S230_9PSEU|nr:hypothetical protein [Prauserella isguenensis]MBB3051838.1 hypothetical protein [Prauserella isguenensis]